jgi:antitoxin ParD1/3/4
MNSELGMNISIELTGNLLEYLDSKVKKGLYKSRSEVIREAIREMLRKDLQEQLDAKGIKPEDLDKLRDDAAGEIIGKKYRKLT